MKKQFTQQNITEIFNLNRSIVFQRIFIGAALLFIIMLLSSASFAQMTLTDIRDAYTDSAAPTSNFGSGTSLKGSATLVTQGQTTTAYFQRSYIEFDRSSLTINLSANDVMRATLRLYVNRVNTSAQGGMLLYGVCNTLNESTVTWNTQPNFCTGFIHYSQAITTANQYVTIDVKPVIAQLLNSGSPTFSFYLQPNGGNIAFDSKESGGNPPTLELELIKVNSVTGTGGLTGGGNNGDLLLSIANGGVTTSKIADGAVT